MGEGLGYCTHQPFNTSHGSQTSKDTWVFIEVRASGLMAGATQKASLSLWWPLISWRLAGKSPLPSTELETSLAQQGLGVGLPSASSQTAIIEQAKLIPLDEWVRQEKC